VDKLLHIFASSKNLYLGDIALLRSKTRTMHDEIVPQGWQLSANPSTHRCVLMTDDICYIHDYYCKVMAFTFWNY